MINILIIYIDDLGYGDIGANGAKGVETPNKIENYLNVLNAPTRKDIDIINFKTKLL